MIGQMLMAGFRGTSVEATSPIVQDIKNRHLGGVVLFDRDVELGTTGRNITSPEQVKKLNRQLQSFAAIPLFIAVDQEGGRVQRLNESTGFHTTPSAQAICASGEFKVRTAGYMTGMNLSANGFNLDFAPVVDVNSNPESPAIGAMGRSFSADPGMVTRCAEIFAGELKRSGVLSCLKHFPGHGSAGTDSHAGLPDITTTWTDAELIPYRELIAKNVPSLIMTGHLFNATLDPTYPATLSKKIITGLLRTDLGYDGVIITDDMNMKAITTHFSQKEAILLAIEAGADILLFGNNLHYDPDIVKTAHAIIKKLVTDKALSRRRIEQSYDRIQQLKEQLS
ncbi:glycoside hydrolase family 3 [Pseudodesulfovibrio sp. JC047]|nr:glycoside hydrolase family 3 [Pseudodesulfovibrio sp. JC047]